jgi:hypothetical protein
MIYILAIVDNFSKYIRLYSTQRATAEEYVRCLVEWVSVFGVPKEIRTDGGPQFDNQLAKDFKTMMGMEHLVIVPYHPQANGIVERRMGEIKNHLQAIVYERRIKEEWSRFLPLVQRIMNYSVDGSIGTQPARVIFGDLVSDDVAMELPDSEKDRSIGDYLIKLRDMHAIIIKATQDFLEGHQRKRNRRGDPSSAASPKFYESQYVLLKYPSRPPNKLAGLYRGPMVISAIDRPDLIRVRDLITDKTSLVHTSRLVPYRHPADMTEEEARELAAADMDEFFVEEIISHRGNGNNPKRWSIRSVGEATNLRMILGYLGAQSKIWRR